MEKFKFLKDYSWCNELERKSRRMLFRAKKNDGLKTLSYHASKRLKEKNRHIDMRYVYHILNDTDLNSLRIIEAKVDENNNVISVLLRVPYLYNQELVMAVCVDCIKTLWLNNRNDNHNTINLKQYTTVSQWKNLEKRGRKLEFIY